MSQRMYTENDATYISNQITRLKELEENISGLKATDVSVFKKSIVNILKKTSDANDERIHSILRQKQLVGETAENTFAELKALEGAKICADDIIEEINNADKYLDEVSSTISSLKHKLNEVKEGIHNQDNA